MRGFGGWGLGFGKSCWGLGTQLVAGVSRIVTEELAEPKRERARVGVHGVADVD